MLSISFSLKKSTKRGGAVTHPNICQTNILKSYLKSQNIVDVNYGIITTQNFCLILPYTQPVPLKKRKAIPKELIPAGN